MTKEEQAASRERKVKVPGYRDLYVTKSGYVYNAKGFVKVRHQIGYVIVSAVTDTGHRKNARVHQLVCLAFHGPRTKEKPIVRHLDGNKKNNKRENLCWGTYEENSRDSVKHGTCTAVMNGKLGALKRMQKGKGVYFNKLKGTWQAKFVVESLRISLGNFKTEKEAVACRQGARVLYERAIYPELEERLRKNRAEFKAEREGCHE